MQLTKEQKLFRILQLGTAMCFIGHGAWGVITKQIWCNYFGVFGIGHDTAYKLMPWVGGIDILLGITMLIYPVRAIALWLVIWGFITASLRPLSGEPFAELIERAGNFGAPLALLALAGINTKNIVSLFKKISIDNTNNNASLKRVEVVLRIAAFLLLLGHGWLNLIHKKGLIGQYTSLGFAHPESTATIVGMLEIACAFIVLLTSYRPVILLLFLWKMLSECFYPQYEIFEWIERGGSYTCLLALWIITQGNTYLQGNKNWLLGKIGFR